MNFLNFLTSGAQLFNFNLQNLNSSSSPAVQPIPSQADRSTQLTHQQKNQAKQEMEAINQQNQALFNQYMHMNIQLLSQKIVSLEKHPEQDKRVLSAKEEISEEAKALRKKNKKINMCGHQDKQHYAKGLCSNCYHKYGRTKKPWNCPHEKLYAGGMCQNCYINSYNKKKRLAKDDGADKIDADLDLKVEESPIPMNIEPASNSN